MVKIVFLMIILLGAAESACDQVVIKDFELGGLPEDTEGTGS